MSAHFYYKSTDAPIPNKPTHIGVAGILLNKYGEMLLERRTDCDRWSLIGGGLKIDESLEQCFLREVLEETGLEVKTFKYWKIFDDPTRIAAYPDGNILRIITAGFIGLVDSENIEVSDESYELKFFDFKHLNCLDIVETHRHIVEEYLIRQN